MLAMIANDNAGNLIPRGVLGLIASMLAPTVRLPKFFNTPTTNPPTDAVLPTPCENAPPPPPPAHY